MFEYIEDDRELDNEVDYFVREGEVGCALPDLGWVLAAAIWLAMVIVAAVVAVRWIIVYQFGEWHERRKV